MNVLLRNLRSRSVMLTVDIRALSFLPFIMAMISLEKGVLQKVETPAIRLNGLPNRDMLPRLIPGLQRGTLKKGLWLLCALTAMVALRDSSTYFPSPLVLSCSIKEISCTGIVYKRKIAFRSSLSLLRNIIREDRRDRRLYEGRLSDVESSSCFDFSFFIEIPLVFRVLRLR